jgi:hypothetical protein
VNFLSRGKQPFTCKLQKSFTTCGPQGTKYFIDPSGLIAAGGRHDILPNDSQHDDTRHNYAWRDQL